MQNSISKIDDLDVSNKWKSRFHLLKNLGADELSHALILKSEAYRALSFKERMFFISNFAAFFGGFLYYFYKRMHLKGLLLLSLSMLWIAALAGIEFVSGVIIPDVVFWSLSACLCSQWANYDLYRKTFHSEQLWDWIPERWRNKSSVLWFLALCAAIWGSSIYYMATHTYSTYAAYDDPNSLRVPCGSFVMLATQEEVDSYGRDVICNQ
ncbi:hypothetical protein VCSRO128_2804 [Vibrio cholerae]|nr:DUF2628 domain-containing protein [Vibrio cholerae]ELG5193588.1 DUF2628 domain-containing protein [Vibrio cholerae]GHZ91170.1 hypothetical protein VCSRO128_2804 [Vibrio cholerae]